jgi:hypothetical protein
MIQWINAWQRIRPELIYDAKATEESYIYGFR